MARFVSEDLAKTMKRTTAKVKQFTTTPSSISVTPQEIPLTVDRFFLIETTSSKIFNDHKLENLKEESFQGSHFLGANEDGINEPLTTPSPSFIRKIHVNNEPVEEETLETTTQRRKRKRTTTPIPDDSSETEDSSEFDNVEFPISTIIKKSGIKSKPRALSAEPTTEELRDHKRLVEIFNEQNEEKNNQELEAIYENIELSVSKKNPPPMIPDLPKIESLHKPYVIRRASKFTTIAPLENIGIEMSTDEPPDQTPSLTPFGEHLVGVWYPMTKGDIPHLGIFAGELRRSPQKQVNGPDNTRLYNEYTKENRRNRPIRVEMDNARNVVKNECESDSNCGPLTVCCTKKWCDRTNNCATGRFCLPNCSSSKLTFLPFSGKAESIIDIMYD